MSRIVTLGEIMARFAAPGFQRFAQCMPGSMEVTFAGAEANMAVGIAQLGGEASFVTALPRNPLADACLANLRALGVDTRHVVRTQDGRMGLFFFEQGVNQRAGQVIYDRDGSTMAITPVQTYDWSEIFKSASWLMVSGITPAISRSAAEVTKSAMMQAQDMGLKVALDINYRSKLWRWDPAQQPRQLAMQTLRDLLSHVHLLIGGPADIAALRGGDESVQQTADLTALATELCAEFASLRMVAMTRRQGDDGGSTSFAGLLHLRDEPLSYLAPLQNHGSGWHVVPRIVDRLGAGDAFSAGLVFALSHPSLNHPQRAISFATAAGCLAHSIDGDYLQASFDEVHELAGQLANGRVRR
jgi:2-dehydro-3-deoxygluconokinase